MTPAYNLNPAKKRGINSGSGLRALRSVNHAVINKIKFSTDEAAFKRAVGLYESRKVTGYLFRYVFNSRNGELQR